MRDHHLNCGSLREIGPLDRQEPALRMACQCLPIETPTRQIVASMQTDAATLAPVAPGSSATQPDRVRTNRPSPLAKTAVPPQPTQETPMPPAPAVPRAYWPHPMGPPTLAREALLQAQADTLAAPRLRYDPFSRLMFLTINVLYGRRRSLEKFLVLEQLARIPYQAWERPRNARSPTARADRPWSAASWTASSRPAPNRTTSSSTSSSSKSSSHNSRDPARPAPLPNPAPHHRRPLARLHLAAPSRAPHLELPPQRQLRGPRRARIHGLCRRAPGARPPAGAQRHRR